MHARKQIRDAVATALTGLATTGANVFAGRTRILEKGHAPALLIYAAEEGVDAHTMGSPRKLIRELVVVVEGRVSEAGPPDDLLDTVGEEVETAIGADPTLGGRAKDIILRRVTLNAEAPGERHEGEIRMEFAVTYRTAENAPGTALA